MCLGSSSSRSERGKIKNQRESEQGREVGVSEIDSWGGGSNLKLIIQWYISNKKREKKAGRAN